MREQTTVGGSPIGFDWMIVLLVLGFIACLAVVPVHVFKAMGLPAHALLVHAPVVLVPLSTLLTLVVVWVPKWRQRYGFALALLILAAAGSAALAAGAGDAFRENVFAARAMQGDAASIDFAHRLSDHAEAGENLRLLMLVFAAASVVVVVADRMAVVGSRFILTKISANRGLSIAAGIVLSVLAILATAAAMYAGHLGAELVWQDQV